MRPRTVPPTPPPPRWLIWDTIGAIGVLASPFYGLLALIFGVPRLSNALVQTFVLAYLIGWLLIRWPRLSKSINARRRR